MINKKYFFENVDRCVFWDLNPESLDFEKDLSFIISRTLMRGTAKEISFIEKNFPLSRIVQAVEKSPEANEKCKNYYTALLRLYNEFGE